MKYDDFVSVRLQVSELLAVLFSLHFYFLLIPLKFSSPRPARRHLEGNNGTKDYFSLRFLLKIVIPLTKHTAFLLASE